jgi:hypothetical protein
VPNRTTWPAAHNRLIRSPKDLKKIIGLAKEALAEDEEERVHPDLRALTRLGEPSVEVICLHIKHGQLYLDSNCTIPAPLEAPLRHEQTKSLLYNSLRIGHAGLVPFLLQQQLNFWNRLAEETPALRRHRLLIFEEEEWNEHDTYRVDYDQALGITIVNRNNEE